MTDAAAVLTQVRARIWIVRTTCSAQAAAAFMAFLLTGAGAGLQGGWLWGPAIVTPLIVTIGWRSWGHGRGRLVAAVSVALGAIALRRWNVQDALASHGRLRAAMDSIPVPATFEHTGDDRSGWLMCSEECTSYTRHWLAHGDAEDVWAQLRRTLEGAGFVLESWPGAGTGVAMASSEGHHGGVRLIVGVDTRWAWRDGEVLVLAPGQCDVTAILEPYFGA